MIQIVGTQLSQWDVGRSVSIANSGATHIHFANQGDSKAVIMEIEGGSAKIPDYLLQTGKQVIAYAVLDGVTLESKSFPVRKRERPENYIYEEDRRNYIYELIANAENATESASMAAMAANIAADNASGAIEAAYNASSSATDAAAEANDAAQNANTAAEFALADSIVNEASGSVITLNDSSNCELQGLKLSNTDAESVTVKVMGKNVLNVLDTVTASNVTILESGENYIIVQCNSGDGSTSWSSGWFYYNDINKIHFQKGVTYTLSAYYTFLEDPKRPASLTNITYYPAPLLNNAALSEDSSKRSRYRPEIGERYRIKSVWTASDDAYTHLFIPIMSGTVKIELPMIEIGDTLTDYEPYKGEQTLVVSVPNGLGADGFVCEDFAQLHTYKPNTTITNDVGAIMEVEYVADTKAYIDNKFTELQNAILASGANV